MYDLGIDEENFNPRVLYIFKRKYGERNSTKYHCHDFISIIYFLSGDSTYNINGTFYQLKKGDLIVINPGVYHCRLMNPGQESMEFHAGFTNICIEGLQKDFLIPENISPVFKFARYEQDFLRCCSEIIAEQEKDEPGCGLLLKSLLMKLIIIFLRETSMIAKDVSLRETYNESYMFNFESYDRVNIVNTIVSYINENYMNAISLEKISRNMYLSPVYISKIFKEEIGESPINYLIKVRLSKALKLLEEGNLPVKAVAKSVGYDDVYHFSKLFKKYYGNPPSRFRKNKPESNPQGNPQDEPQEQTSLT
ncbi:MAG: helix-turn-helix transcriptional regulator [Firmicutes bacterium]|nr:helix-turn-helix transcriptional regulator [Bacillota bacterium]